MRKVNLCPELLKDRNYDYITWSLVCFLFIFFSGSTNGQTKIVADQATITTPGNNRYEICYVPITNIPIPCGLSPTVQNVSHATVENNQYARMYASPGLLLGLGSYKGGIEFTFPQTLVANQWSYVRIGADNSLLRLLLGGSLGESLGTILGAVLLGNQEIEIEALQGTTSRLKRTNTQGFDTDRVRLIKDAAGNYYIAIRPNGTYNKIRLTNQSTSVAGLYQEYTLDAYYALSYTDDPSACGRPTFTSFDGGSGLGLKVADLDNQRLERAIDNDVDTYAELKSSGILDLTVGRSLSQFFYFHAPSTGNHTFNIKLGLASGGLANLDLLGALQVIAWDGNQAVYTKTLSGTSYNGLNILELFDNPQLAATLTFAPGRAFDRIEIRLNSVVGLDLIGNGIRIYDVQRYSGSPDCINPNIIWEGKTTPPFNQQDCGTTVTSFEQVDFPYEAVTDNPQADTYATLSAGAGVAVGLGAYSSHLELKYTAPVAAHEVSYIRVDSETNLFKSLLGGSLGNALAGALGSVALGDQYIQIRVKDAAGNQIGAVYNSQLGLNTEFVRLVQDKAGRFYLAVTAAHPYQSIRIEYHHTALVGVRRSSSIKVYSMCREMLVDLCEQATFTSWDGNGIALDIANLAAGGVADPEFAIDDNNSNYSTLNLGIVGVGASVSQTVYFKSKSTINDALRVRLQLRNPGTLNVDLLGQARLKLYNGENLVYNQPLTAGLINNLDLLALFNTGGVQSLTFYPNVVYDRARIEVNSIAGLNISAPIHLYGMSRITAGCPDPDFMAPPYRNSVCADVVETGMYGNNEYHTYAVDDIENAVDGNHNSYASIRSGAGIVLGINDVSGKLTLAYQGDTPANRISYIRIAENRGLLDALLSGSLGNVVGGLVNNIALGNHYFTVDVQDASGNNLVSGNSQSAFAGSNGKIRIVQDKAGRYYIALTADQAYRKVVIKTFTESVVGVTAQDNALQVYGMCYETDFDGCAEAVTTSWDGAGLTTGIIGIGEYGVQDAFKALDNNNNGDYSTLSLGTLNVAGYVQQNIQFNKAMAANSLLRLKMSVGQGQVDVSVFGRMKLVAYKGGTEVYNQTLPNAAIGNVNLAQLFDNGATGEIAFSPNVEFDEVALRLDALAGVSVVVPNVRLYYIVQDCNLPVFEAWKSYQEVNTGTPIAQVKGEEEIIYSIHIRNTGTVDLDDYIVSDAIPAYTTYVAGSADADGGTFANGEVVFNGVDVEAGATKVLTFRVKVDGNLTGVDKISNVAVVKKDENDPGIGTVPPADPSNPVAPHPTADPGTPTDIPVQHIKNVLTWKAYAIANGVSTTSVRGDEDVTYTIYMRNTGNQNLTGLLVSDAIPQGTTFQSANNGGVYENGTVTFSGIDLPVGGSASVSFVVKVNADLTGRNAIDNIAYVHETPGDPGTPTAPADPSNPTAGPGPGTNPGDPTSIPVDDNFDLVLWKAYRVRTVGSNVFDPAITTVSGGELIEYTVYVKNRGNKALTNIVVTDPLVQGVTLEPGYLSSTTITTLAVGETKSYSFRVKVNADLTNIEQIRNIATAVSNEISTARQSHPPVDNTDPSTADETKIGTIINVTPIHDVNIELNGVSDGTNSGMAILGDKITYTITVTNTGNKDLTGLTLTGDVPLSTTYEGSTTGGTLNGNEVTFPPFDLAVGETKTFVYVVEANSITPPTPIVNEAVVHYEDPQGANVSKNDTHSMPTDCTPVVAGDFELSASGPVCLGEKVTLTASLATTSSLNPTVLSNVVWYSSYNTATGTLSGEVGVGQSIEVTPVNLVTKYYVAVTSADYCFQNPPAEISVTVNDVPSRPVIAAIVTDHFCDGDVMTLTVSNVQAGATYTWFRNATLVGTGTSHNADATGEYTVQASLGACLSELSTGVHLTVYPRPVANDIQITGNEVAVCEGVSVRLQASLVTNPSTVVTNPVFHWYSDAALTNRVYTGNILEINPQTTVTYYVTVVGDNVCENAAGTAKEVTITVNPTPVYTVNGALSYGIEVGQSVTLPTISAPTATVTWYDDAGNNIGAATATRSFDAVGTYTYTAVVSEANHCTVSISVVIHVFAPGECPPVYRRVYATDASSYGVSRLLVPLGTVSDRANAADGNVETYSTLTEGLNLLSGILTGQTYQTLKWSAPVAAGTPVSVKLGKNLSTVNALGTLRLVAVNANGQAVSTVQDVEPKLVEVLGGLNVYEYTFTPVNQNGQAIAYSGVKVYFAGVASVLQTARIYEAYYHEVGAVDCGAEEVFDILHGVENPIQALGVANALIGVTDVEHAVDNDPATYALMNNVAAVNAKSRLEVLYHIPVLAGDKLLINLSVPSSLLSVQALQSFTIQPYLGNVPVGQPISQDGVILKVDILSGGSEALVTYTADRAFDRIKILYGGVADVLTQLRVHEITREIPELVTGDNNDNKFQICAGGDISIMPSDNCTTYTIYNSVTGGSVVDVKTLEAGTHTVYVQTVRFGTCEVGERTAIEITVNASPVAPVVADQTICQTSSASTVSYDVTALTGHDLIYYANASSTTPLTIVPTANSANVGTTTVYVSQRSVAGCESPRVPVRITVTRTATAADIIVNDVTICEGESLILSASSATVSNPVFRFYADAALTTEITNVTVAPTVSRSYYVTVTGDGVCVNPLGQAAVINVEVVVTAAPTIDNAIPEFCISDNKTLADLAVVGTSIKWYTAATGGTLLASSTLLQNGVTYYASQMGASCESFGRLAVTPMIIDCEVKLAITKQADDNRVVAGQNTSFTLTIINNGPGIIETGDIITLEDIPSTGLEITGFTLESHYGSISFVGNRATITANDVVPVNGTIIVKVLAKVTADAPATIRNAIKVWGPDTPTTDDPDDEDETPDIPVDREYNLGITKVADQTRVKAGESTTFTVTVRNNGPSAIAVGKEIRLGEIPSTGLTITGYTVTSGNGSVTGTGNSATVTTGQVIGVGSEIVVRVTALVSADAPATIRNAIKVWGPDKPTTDDPDDEDETPDIPVDREYNLGITKVADQARVKAGESTTFTVTIRNNGPSAIAVGKEIRLGEIPSTGLTITGYAVTSGNGTVTGTGNSATVMTSQVIGVGGEIVVRVTALVSADAPATIRNAIKVWGPDKPTTDDPDDEDETPDIPVDREYNLGITKVADQARVKAGESTTFTVTVTNNGPSVIEIGKNILLRERPGNGVIVERYEMISSNATINGTGNSATLTTTSKIGVNETIVVRIVAKVDDDAPATITNGIDVWRPDVPPTDDPDDEDDTPDIPVDYPLIEAIDDFAEVKIGSFVRIVVLGNDIVTKWDIDPATVEITQQPSFGEVEVLPNGEIIFTAPKDRLGEVQFRYTVRDIKGRQSNDAVVIVNVIDNPLEIPDVITPNGDNVNDYFVIRGLELYDHVRLTILNRWGNEVYKHNTYNNEWDGRGLNEGTYFYVLELSKDGKVTKHTGSVLIKRN